MQFQSIVLKTFYYKTPPQIPPDASNVGGGWEPLLYTIIFKLLLILSSSFQEMSKLTVRCRDSIVTSQLMAVRWNSSLVFDISRNWQFDEALTQDFRSVMAVKKHGHFSISLTLILSINQSWFLLSIFSPPSNPSSSWLFLSTLPTRITWTKYHSALPSSQKPLTTSGNLDLHKIHLGVC